MQNGRASLHHHHPLSSDTLVYALTFAGDPQISPDGSKNLYTRSRSEREARHTATQVWVCDTDGSHHRHLTYTGQRNVSPRWSPDGTRIAVISDRVTPAGLCVLPIDGGGEARALPQHDRAIDSLAWSPDGQSIAYTVVVDPADWRPGAPERAALAPVRVARRTDYKQDGRGFVGDARSHVFVIDVETGARRQVTSGPVDHYFPCWSPDGTWLAIQVPDGRGVFNAQLALVSVATGQTRLVGPELGVVDLWSWSPAGDRIIVAGDTRQTFQLDFFVYDVVRDSLRRLTDDLQCLPVAGYIGGAAPAQPVWLDDRRVLFHAIHAAASGLYVIDSETGDVELIQRWQALHAGMSVDTAGRLIAQAHASFERVGDLTVYDLQMTALGRRD
jgi:Tol biopolymer transport system component